MEDIWSCKFPHQEILNEKFKDYSCYLFHQSWVLIVDGFSRNPSISSEFLSIKLFRAFPYCLFDVCRICANTFCSILILMICVFSIFIFVSLARVC